MWFVFPQIEEQENSLVARECAIRDLDEAKLYVCHLLRSQG
jgi:uncharacterized protein (DUF1810 family)